jgi:hypothetical protein
MEVDMSTLDRIAFFQNRRDEVPNQTLARELAGAKDEAGIREIAGALHDRNKNIRSDCIKVLYEIGYLDPGLISAYGKDFLDLLKSKDNRMVWGGMIGLATIADRIPGMIWEQIDEVIRITASGTVITLVWGMRVLARVAAAEARYKDKIFPFLLGQVRTCLPRDVPTHTESILYAVDEKNKAALLAVLETRRGELTGSQLTRFRKAWKQLERI